MKILYWNLNQKPLEGLVAALAHEQRADVLLLSECDLDMRRLLAALNRDGDPVYGIAEEALRNDPMLISLYPPSCFSKVLDDQYISTWRFRDPLATEILIFCIHLPSKLRQKTEDQTLMSTRWRSIIEGVEKDAGHRLSVVIGDFNMDPFECGIIGSEGLHAVMSRRVAKRGFRRVHDEERFFFYNPMWSCFGEYPSGPLGTYFYDSGTAVNFYWHLFDQVLIRPELLDCFRDETLSVLTAAGHESLLTRSGRPGRNNGSDHLPIVFSLEMTKGG